MSLVLVSYDEVGIYMPVRPIVCMKFPLNTFTNFISPYLKFLNWYCRTAGSTCLSERKSSLCQICKERVVLQYLPILPNYTTQRSNWENLVNFSKKLKVFCYCEKKRSIDREKILKFEELEIKFLGFKNMKEKLENNGSIFGIKKFQELLNGIFEISVFKKYSYIKEFPSCFITSVYRPRPMLSRYNKFLFPL